MARRELEGLPYADPNNTSQLPLEPLLGVSADHSSVPLNPEASMAMEVDDDSTETEKKGKANLTQRLRFVIFIPLLSSCQSNVYNSLLPFQIML